MKKDMMKQHIAHGMKKVNYIFRKKVFKALFEMYYRYVKDK